MLLQRAKQLLYVESEKGAANVIGPCNTNYVHIIVSNRALFPVEKRRNTIKIVPLLKNISNELHIDAN